MIKPHRILYPLIALSMILVMATTGEQPILIGAGIVTVGAVVALVVAERQHRHGQDPGI